MKLQQLISEHEFNFTVPQIKAFFLGSMNAQKAMPFSLAIEELLGEKPQAALEQELKKLWDDLQMKKIAETHDLFEESENIVDFLSTAKEQLDQFLTALSLAGTHEDSVDEELAEILDELEETVMDIDEYLSDSAPDENEGAEIKELLLDTWKDFIETKKF